MQAVNQRVESIGAIALVAGQQLLEVLLLMLMVLMVVLLVFRLLMMLILNIAVGLRRTDVSHALVIVRLGRVARVVRFRVPIAAAARIAEVTASPGVRIEVNILDGGGGRGVGSIGSGGIVRSILHQVDDGRRCSS